MKARTTLAYRRSIAAIYGDAQRWRRWDRVWAGIVSLACIAAAVMAVHRGRSHAFWDLLPALWACAISGPYGSCFGSPKVTQGSLEDRADFEYGKSFEELQPMDQERLLRKAPSESTLFTDEEPSIKYPGVLPDTNYFHQLQAAARGMTIALALLLLAEGAKRWLPDFFLPQMLTDEARPWFWAVLLVGLLPYEFLVLRGPRVIPANPVH